MKRVLSVILSIIIACSCLTCVFSAGTKEVTVDVIYHQTEARSILGRINELRTSDDAWYLNKDNTTKTYCHGLSALEYDYDLEQFAMLRAAEIALNFSHTRPDGTLSVYGFTGTTRAENIAAGYTNAGMVQEAFEEVDEDYAGQGHRRNMLNSSITAVGIACAEYNGRKYWVQEFRAPTGSTVETVANDGPATVTVTVTDTGNDPGTNQDNPGDNGGQDNQNDAGGNWFDAIIAFFRSIIDFFIMLFNMFN
ncbi:MAG: CAP domain-containing protein [Clostridia bacterium]|nr:CAP domain-containing protein [Clostridia bacterium]